LTKSRTTFYAQIKCRGFRTASTAHQAVQQVERGDAGLNEVARHRARHRIHRQAVEREFAQLAPATEASDAAHG